MAKTDTDKTPDVTDEPDTKTAASLTKDFDRESGVREFGELHRFTFADGTAAKVWTADSDHVNVQLLDLNGRGTNDTTHLSVTVAQANKLIESAGQKAKDEVAAAQNAS